MYFLLVTPPVSGGAPVLVKVKRSLVFFPFLLGLLLTVYAHLFQRFCERGRCDNDHRLLRVVRCGDVGLRNDI